MHGLELFAIAFGSVIWGEQNTQAHGHAQLDLAFHRGINLVDEIGLAEIAVREDVGLLAYSPLAQGFLTGKYQRGAKPAGARLTLYDRGQRYEKPGVEVAIDAYLSLAADHGLDPSQLAIAFVLSRPFVTSAIIGATTLEQLEINLGALEVTITPGLAHAIDAIHQVHSNPAP